MTLFTEIGSLRHLPPKDSTVQEKIGDLQSFITGHYYTCTNEILSDLGQMYVEDRRMRENIDKVGGDGCLLYTSRCV